MTFPDAKLLIRGYRDHAVEGARRIEPQESGLIYSVATNRRLNLEHHSMSLVKIRGDASVIIGLQNIEDLQIFENSLDTLPSGELQLTGFATEEVISEAQARGAVVQVIMSDEEMKTRADELFSDNPQPPVG